MLYLGIDQHARQLTISLRNEEGDVVEAGAALGNEAADGALILLGVAGRAVPDLEARGGIVVLQELQLAVADGDERYAQAADRPGRAGMIDDAVLVRCKALDRLADLHIGLAAFVDTTNLVDEDGFRDFVVGRGDAESSPRYAPSGAAFARSQSHSIRRAPDRRD